MPQIKLPVNDGYSPEQQKQSDRTAENNTPQDTENTTQQTKKQTEP